MKKTVFLGIGERALPCEKIIGIFDLDKTTVKKDTREFLKINEQKGLVQTVGFDIPLSFIVTADKKNSAKKSKEKQKNRVILSPVSASTLLSRAKNGG